MGRLQHISDAEFYVACLGADVLTKHNTQSQQWVTDLCSSWIFFSAFLLRVPADILNYCSLIPEEPAGGIVLAFEELLNS